MRSMRALASVLVPACVVPVSLQVLASPAWAGEVTVEDAAGDGEKGDRLDMTTAGLSNRDHALVVDVSFVKAAAGDLGVWVKARGAKRRDQVLVASIHRPKAGDRNFVRAAGEEETCAGLRVAWDHDADTAQVRLPSKCFLGGDYGAVAVRVITEIGSDADFTDDGAGKWTWTDWAPRG
jgi:hypothetical protein